MPTLPTSALGAPGPKLEVMEFSVALASTQLPAFMLRAGRAAMQAPYGCLSLCALLIVGRRVLTWQAPFRLDGKLVLVSGVTSRLGREVCRRLLACGATLVLVGPKGRSLDGFVSQIKGSTERWAQIMTRQCNCRNGQEVDSMMKDISSSVGVPDAVVRIEEEGPTGVLTDLPLEEVRETLEEGLLPVAHMVRSLVRSMLLKPSASIMLVHSAVSRGRWQNSAMDVTAGWGRRGLLGALRSDLAGSSVSVQEYLVRPREEQTAAAAGIAAMEDAAAVVSAIEARVPLASAEAGLASSYALPSAAYPVVCHAALACLTALVPGLLA